MQHANAQAQHRHLGPADVGLPPGTHRRGFDAIAQEFSYWVDDVGSDLPSGFAATLFRNGPGRNRIGAQPFGHWFDGDGMVSRITFRDGRVHYANRFVRTRKYMDETAAQRIVHRGFGTQRPGGVFANFLRPPANPANTGLILHGGKFLALWEGGHPHELDPATLETRGEYHYDGALQKLWPFSAHGKVDPASGDYINFGVQPAPTTRLNLYRISPQGKLVATGHVPLGRPVFLHDFSMTEHHAIFFVSSIVMRGMWRFLAGLCSLDDCLAFDPGMPLRLIVVDLRSMEKVLDVEQPPAVVIHCGNAWQDEDGRLVAEVTHYPDFAADLALRDMAAVDVSAAGDLYRYRIDLASASVQATRVDGLLPADFPMWDWRRSGRRTRFHWHAAVANNGTPHFFNALQRLDRDTGAVQTHDFGPGRFCMEPVHMPLGVDSAEDEALIGTLLYDYGRDASEILLLDAADLGRVRLRARLPHHVPFGFHGLYVPQTFA